MHMIVEQLTCLARDLQNGKIDYTNTPQITVNVNDRNMFLTAFRKVYVSSTNMIEDFFVEQLHSPLWVCRQTLSNGEKFWVLSNIANEVSLLMITTKQVASNLTSTSIYTEN